MYHFMFVEKFPLHGLTLFHFKFNVLFTTIGRTPEPRRRQKKIGYLSAARRTSGWERIGVMVCYGDKTVNEAAVCRDRNDC